MIDNKRKEIDKINEHHEKDNDDDNDGIDNGLLTYKKFKKDFDSGSTNYRELQIIAKSLGLPNNGKKQVIYNRIEGYFLSKKVKNNLTNNETNQQEEKKKEEQERQPQSQPQPQEKQYILSIKDVEPVEIYFWKVFRNIVTFKQIFSNFNNKQYGYYDLIGCDGTFLNGKTNSLEIIIDNIKSNNNHQIIRNNKNIINIINKFKKNDEKTRSFYNLLFSRYTSTSPTQLSSTIQFDENIDKCIQTMIKNINYTALDQFIKFYKIDSEVIKKSIEIHIDPSFFGNTTYDKLKIYNYLKSINCLPTSHKLLPFISTDLPVFLSFDNKFKKLIKSYKRLIESTNLQERIEQQEQKEKIKIHPNNKKYYEKSNQIILELNEIQTSQFTNDQLNSTIKNLLNHTTSTSTTNLTIISTASNKVNLKDIIKKYYKSIYLFFYCTDISDYERIFRKPLLYYINFKNERVDKMYERVVNKWKGSNFDHQLFFQNILKDTNIEKNEKFELISNVLDNKYVRTFEKYEHNIFFKAVFSSNDIELIDYLFKKIKQPNQTQKETGYPSIGKLIGNHYHLIDKKEILDFYFQNYRDESILFDDQNECCKCIQLELIEHYEYLMDSIGKRCKLDFNFYYNDPKFLDRLNRAIVKPLVYSISVNGYFDDIVKWLIYNINNNNQNSIITFLSNAQLKQPLNLEILESNFNPYSSKMLTLAKFLFNNISKESIETKLKVINLKTDNKKFEEVNSKIELTTTLITTTTTTTTTNLLSSENSEDVGRLIIGKTESFNFTISIRMLLVCLYNLDRVDDIIYLFDKLPEVLFNPYYFSIFTKEHCLYSISSSYYLELFINYFIKNLNGNTINYLYNCLCIASRKGYTQIFKNIISSDQNSKYLLKIQTKSNQSSLFDSKLLNDIVVKSINSSNFELSNLLIDFIDFSEKDQNTLKMKILKSK
ncbi:hypothetical protein ACTFIY_007207 [Dictyostelium cf. discoideum]